jgi:HTH-type transcriptional regulator, sugar sensing transcriptional regulator
MKAEELVDLGLTDGEAKAYLALLNLGSSTVGPIVKESKIAYSNIYEVLDRLIDKGLVSLIIKEKTKYFQAAEPHQLEHFLEKKEEKIKEQKERLKTMIPSLIKLTNTKEEKLEAEIFSGYKGLRTAFLELIGNLDTKKKTDYVFFYVNYGGQEKQVDDFFMKLIPLLKKPYLTTKGVASHTYRNSAFLKKAQFVKMKFVNFPVLGNVDICNNKTLITTWGEIPVSILINSKEVAQNLKNYFEFVWNSGK